MEINQSNYKSAKIRQELKESRLRQANGTATRAANKSGNTGQGPMTAGIKEGRTIKGEIIDHRYNGVKIRLEPGNQILTATLTGEVSLSIGQEARFLVTEISGEQLTLRYIPTDQPPLDSLVSKVLKEAGLPLSKRNCAIVMELINHNMPVDKNTLLAMIKLTAQHREAPIPTLVLMYQHKLPVSTESLQQFEAYQTGTHQLLKELHTITDRITGLIQTAYVDDQNIGDSHIAFPEQSRLDIVIDLNKRLLSLLTDDSRPEESVAHNLGLIKSILTPDELEAFKRMLMTELQNNYDDGMKSYGPTDLSVDQLEDGALPADEAVRILNAFLEINPKDRLEERTVLTDYILSLSDGTGENSPVERLLDGTVPLQKILRLFQEFLEQPSANLGKLFTSKEYQKLLSKAFHLRWTLTPEKLTKKASVMEYYLKLQEDMDQLSEVFDNGSKLMESLQLKEPVKHLQDNLQFMRDLNELVKYIQLPVRFTGQDVHGDLYVYTKQHLKNTAKDSFHVLLHLDMSSLGPLDIQMNIYRQQIQATFILTDELSEQLLSEYLPELASALSDKGYQLQARTKYSMEKRDFVKDILKPDQPDQSLFRYSFDIRA